jgi:hypothetical protein
MADASRGGLRDGNAGRFRYQRMRCGAFKLDSEPTGGHRHIPEDKDPRSWHLHLQVTSTQALSRVDMSARNDQWPQT